MSTLLVSFVRSPTSLAWWQYGKLLGALLLLGLLYTLAIGIDVSPIAIGLIIHVALDFTLQSSWVAAEKPKRGMALLVHALIAGSIPSAIAGLAVSPQAALVGILAGAVSHYATDYTRKFGVESVAVGATLDQAVHILVIVALTV